MTPALPPDLAALARAYSTMVEEVRTLVAGLSPTQLNWQPRAGRAWSIGQCLEHLAIAARAYLDELEPAVADARRAGNRPRTGELRLPAFGAWFVAQLEPPPKRRLPAPAKIQPPSTVEPAGVVASFATAHERAAALLPAAAEVDLNRVRFRNPFVPLVRFTVGTGLVILAAHSRRHLAQARSVRAAADFPTS